ncbi:MAG: multiheme c-type cytochrome [Saprospiraceae bacterium]|nr:multiheme c-type cytochrome [Saprospiraceae bacterium]
MTKKSSILLLFLAAFVCYCMCTVKGPDYYSPPALATHFNGEQFVGSKTCLECHKDIVDSHLQTAHFNTSSIATRESIKGSFADGANKVAVGDFVFTMKSEGGSFYQHTEYKDAIKPAPPARLDMVIGSGVKGQSYLTWENDHLYQLQVSYYPASDRWINSPGYPSQPLKRPIRDACLKCHVTFATNRDFSGQGNRYDRERTVYGVDCERCHQPSAKHVIYHRSNPEAVTTKYMLKLDTLPRQRRLDACAQCHSGLRSAIIKGNSFSYLTGEDLNEYSRNFYTGQPQQELDVHGNQYGLLTSSKCFKQTSTMDCGTCHDPHTNQRGDTAFFNQKCMGCHSAGSVDCSAETSLMSTMANNCIACHMPNIPSKLMSFQLGMDSVETPVYVRTHLIGIYQQDQWHQ